MLKHKKEEMKKEGAIKFLRRIQRNSREPRTHWDWGKKNCFSSHPQSLPAKFLTVINGFRKKDQIQGASGDYHLRVKI